MHKVFKQLQLKLSFIRREVEYTKVHYGDSEPVPQTKQKHLQFSALAPLQNTHKQFLRTLVHVRESYQLLFISIPVPSRSLVKASQNPPAKLYLKPKGVYARNFLYEENLHINPLRPEGNCPGPIPNSLAFFGIFQSERKHKINHMCSNHRHKIRFQDVVY